MWGAEGWVDKLGVVLVVFICFVPKEESHELGTVLKALRFLLQWSLFFFNSFTFWKHGTLTNYLIYQVHP